ncbi:HAD-IA family hydrolase [Lentisphaera profundi]|uniref:HAD-IA family hydrolase n=1 Tax=Lentisphaera profundi TaxID=1658616 RepID=A0ABY7VYG1_9BACT|nr:HAD-IA family hydrolase [Lentisphaera profundi]WDE98245.1 HAD-IA family hydrolase [Lentisphaera profundi]
MFKALFFDMDDTLCDTQGANLKAVNWLINELSSHDHFDHETFVSQYLAAIYRELDEELKQLTSVIDDESDYRHFVFDYFLKKHEIKATDDLMSYVSLFDKKRIEYYDFYLGVTAMLKTLRSQYKIILITNGPAYSQIPKVEQVKMKDYCDHIIIGGLEPEQKPAKSIFDKACSVANCLPNEAIHSGDSLNSDIKGAKAAGIKTFWILPKFTSFSEGNKESDYVSNTILDIDKILESEL